MPFTRRAILRAIPAMGFVVASSGPYAYAPASVPGTSNADILNDLRLAVCAALGRVPEVGALLSVLVAMLWPVTKQDVWEQLRKQVEALINAKIDAAVFSIQKAKLDGLSDGLKLYLQALASRDAKQIVNYFDAANFAMTVAAREFSNPDFSWTLGVLLCVLAQLHMSLLRDAVVHGKDWGWSAAAYDSVVTQSKAQLATYIDTLNKVVDKRRRELTAQVPSRTREQYRTLIYNYWQPFEATRILLFSDTIVLLNATVPGRPDAAPSIGFEDVYSAAYGTAVDCDRVCKEEGGDEGIGPRFRAPLAAFSRIDIEYFNAGPRVVQVSYPAQQGPLRIGKGRVDQCQIIANWHGGVEKASFSFPAPAPGKRFNVEKAYVTSGDTPIGLTLVMDDGKPFVLWTRGDLSGRTSEVAVPGRMLTTFNMWTRSAFYDDDLGCLILGFSRDPDFIPDRIKRLAYITAVEEPNTGPRDLPESIDSTLRDSREQFWRDIMSIAPH